MPAKRIVIEIEGGIVTCITASGECQVQIIDHDNIKNGLGANLDKYDPDNIVLYSEIDNYITETTNQYYGL